MSETDRDTRLIRLFSEEDNHRLRYAAHVVFERILGMEISFESDAEGAHICYAPTRKGGGIHICPSGLLRHEAVVSDPSGTHWEELPALFPSNGDIPFDLLSAVFFLTTRMEEYGPASLDVHGRFPSTESWMARHGLLDQPVVDQWAYRLRRLMKENFRGLVWPERKFRLTSTVDVDSAFAYRGKGFRRTLGGFVRDILRGDTRNFSHRRRTVFGDEPDPFNTYAQINDLHSRYPVELIYFFLLADFQPPHDISLPWHSRRLEELIRFSAKLFPVGIHPGYHAAEDADALGRETARLSGILKGSVEHGRYHYLRGRFPHAFTRLEAVGIQNDYTMGFADSPGFRLGTCTPVPFYDLKHEVVSSLLLHPTAIMDTTLVRYEKLTSDEALERLAPLVEAVREVEGNLICLWHNETWSEFKHWKGWSGFPEEIFKLAFPPS